MTKQGITITPGSRSKKKLLSKFNNLDHDESRDTLASDVESFLNDPANTITTLECGESGVYDNTDRHTHTFVDYKSK